MGFEQNKIEGKVEIMETSQESLIQRAITAAKSGNRDAERGE
jgi:hypothetical protein